MNLEKQVDKFNKIMGLRELEADSLAQLFGNLINYMKRLEAQIQHMEAANNVKQSTGSIPNLDGDD